MLTLIKYNKKYFNDIYDKAAPEILENQLALEEEMGFKYRQGIDGLLFDAIICHPEFMYVVIKLS